MHLRRTGQCHIVCLMEANQTDGCHEEVPTAEDIARCASVLRRMQPSDLMLPDFEAIREAGVPIFKRIIMKDKFGSGEVVEFLKEKTNVKKMNVKLERLHKVVKDEHDARRKKAETCGMNLRRKADLAAIKAESAMLETDVLNITDADVTGYGEEPTMVDKRTTCGDAGTEVSNHDTASVRHIKASGDDAGTIDFGSILNAPRDSFYSHCNMCRGEYLEHHHFYHQLCPRCAEHNWEKRQQTADMSGMVCVVTGGRVRIGYQIVLKLLRAGAFVLTTTRFPNDCALRFSREADFDIWRDRLEVCGPVELCDMRLVEHFCDQLVRRFPRIHVLINNAAQTLTRQQGWNERMADLEDRAASSLVPSARAILLPPGGPSALCLPVSVAATKPTPMPRGGGSSSDNTTQEENVMWKQAEQLQDFPEGQLDESRQPLDLSAANSWSRRLGDVSTLELLQTLAANTAAPFIMCSRLACVLAPKDNTDPCGQIINVSALEGKFSVKNKSSGHPHTNMAKAALNMLTHTSCKDMFQRRILMNCVDTGWVTDMAPGGVGAVAATHATWVGPPLDEEDGAARVLDPVFSHLLDSSWLLRGKFFKNYYVCGW